MPVDIPDFNIDKEGNVILSDAPDSSAGTDQSTDTAVETASQEEPEQQPAEEPQQPIDYEKKYNDLLSGMNRMMDKRLNKAIKRVASEFDSKLNMALQAVAARKTQEEPEDSEVLLSDRSKLDAYIKAKGSEAASEAIRNTFGDVDAVKKTVNQSQIALEYQEFQRLHPEYVRNAAVLDPMLERVLARHPEATYESALETVKDILAVAVKAGTAKPTPGKVSETVTKASAAQPSGNGKRELTPEQKAEIDKRADKLKTQEGVSVGSAPRKSGGTSVDDLIESVLEEHGF